MEFIAAALPPLWIAVVGAALLYHLYGLTRPNRMLHAAYAAAAAGLILILGIRTFGWSWMPPSILMWVFLALFCAVAIVAAQRRTRFGAIGAPWLSALIQLGAVAYMFAPALYWKPPLAFLLLLYFAFEVVGWLRGQEETEVIDADSRRPPLFPPKRRRGMVEIALAATGAAMVYLLFVGPRAPEAVPEASQTAESESVPADSSSEAASKESETALVESPPAESSQTAAAPEAPASEKPEAAAAATNVTYTVIAGDTFKTIAKRVLGDKQKWRAIASLNPSVKGNKLRAGQVLKLPDLPQQQ